MEKIQKVLIAFPFCLPFAFGFFAFSYYLPDAWSWLSIALAVVLGVLSFVYVSLGKEKEMRICNRIGILISFIINRCVWNSIDKTEFFETHDMTLNSYFRLLTIIQLLIPFLAMITVRIIKKIKNKKT